MKTLVLLSGGIDSATVLAMCLASSDTCMALAVDYGQPNHIELDHAADIAQHYGVPFEVISLPDSLINIKAGSVVYVGRNLVLASLGIAMAQARGFKRVGVGCNATDFRRFPDCRPVFWESLSQSAQAYGVGLFYPLVHMTKREVVQRARNLGVPIELTWSCYAPGVDKPCGECLACKVREEALCAPL
jgi:7-cyano-7-deazaguanine synthase